MISVDDLMVIAGSRDMANVTRTVTKHCVAYRNKPDSYTPAERALLTEASQWRRNDPRPPAPPTTGEAIAQALQRQVPDLDDDMAAFFAAMAVMHLQAAPAAAPAAPDSSGDSTGDSNGDPA